MPITAKALQEKREQRANQVEDAAANDRQYRQYLHNISIELNRMADRIESAPDYYAGYSQEDINGLRTCSAAFNDLMIIEVGDESEETLAQADEALTALEIFPALMSSRDSSGTRLFDHIGIPPYGIPADPNDRNSFLEAVPFVDLILELNMDPVIEGGVVHDIPVNRNPQPAGGIDAQNQIIGDQPGENEQIIQDLPADNQADADLQAALDLDRELNGGAAGNGMNDEELAMQLDAELNGGEAGNVMDDAALAMQLQQQEYQDNGGLINAGQNAPVMDQGQKEIAWENLLRDNMLSFDETTRGMLGNARMVDRDQKLSQMAYMFNTRTRRLYINSSEYNRAKNALDDYMQARTGLRSRLETLKNEYMLEANGILGQRRPTPEIMADVRRAYQEFQTKEAALRDAMKDYVSRKTKGENGEIGNKKVEDMKHGYGAARLVAAKDVLGFLDSQRGRPDLRRSGQEPVTETSFKYLFETKYELTNGRREKDRRKKSADYALDNVKYEAEHHQAPTIGPNQGR